MKKIIVITNMESTRLAVAEVLQQLKEQAKYKTLSENIFIKQITTEENFDKLWERELLQAAFVLIPWMGTGLDCDFLKKSSAFMHKHNLTHLYSVVDAGNDSLSCGMLEGDISIVKKYLSCGGLVNYVQLFLWLGKNFAEYSCEVLPPQEMPQDGIYHPDDDKCYESLKEYKRKHFQPGKPTIGFIFFREDWLWRRLSFEREIIRAAEAQGCNIIAVFTQAYSEEKSELTIFNTLCEKYFFADNGKTLIDVLINPFVFSLTVRGFAKVDDFISLQVPILQVYNLYMDYNWWESSMIGLTPNEVGYAVAMPEFDGVIHAVPTSTNELAEDGSHFRRSLHERIDMLIRKAKKWSVLRCKPNNEKKVAVVFHNFPPTNSNIGSAAHLDSIESVRLLFKKMREEGYVVRDIPEDSRTFIEAVTDHATNDREYMSEKLVESADGKLHKKDYAVFFDKLPSGTRQKLQDDWGMAPGELFRYGDDLLVPGMLNGNIFVTVQPPRGFGDDPGKIYHSPDCAPTHHYLGFYYWLRDVWGADAMLHIGTHGSLEWLPGKGNAMSGGCYPDICTGDMPNIYPYWITCVGEGIQAKRRSAACLISYLSAPMSVSGSYEELAELEQLLEEYCHFKNDDTVDVEVIRDMIRNKAEECNLMTDVPEEGCADFEEYLGKLHGFITDLKNMQISTGLHILGDIPRGEEMTEYIACLTKLDNGDVPSLTKTLAEARGYDYYELMENSSAMLPDKSMTYGMLLDNIREKCLEIIRALQEEDFSQDAPQKLKGLAWFGELPEPSVKKVLSASEYICKQIAPGLLQTYLETVNSLRALDGCYIEPCASGAPTSGGADLLPTGRNFYSVDPRTLPTKAAWEIGKTMGDNVITKFIGDEGKYPESVGIILWATSNMRNHGQCVAEFLYLLGVRPVWQPGSLRVKDLEVIPLEELQRPRIDVTGRISGLFRDSMQGSVNWLDEAVRRVAALEEPLELNFVRKHVIQESGELEASGVSASEAWSQSCYRIFGDPPGAHGAGIGALLEAKNWENVDDIASVYTRWGGHAYGDGSDGIYMPERFKRRMSEIDITIQNIDHRESSMLSGDDYNNYRGGMVAAVRSYKGSMPRNYVNDSSDRSKIVLRTLDEELKRWFRGEAMNPKYIEGMKKHGYKGAGDLATYVAVSYQWDATSEIMEDWMYEKYATKYALDEKMQKWMQEVNPWALKRITEVLLEAEQRGMWQPEAGTKEALLDLYLSIDGELEERGDKIK